MTKNDEEDAIHIATCDGCPLKNQKQIISQVPPALPAHDPKAGWTDTAATSPPTGLRLRIFGDADPG